MIVDWFNRGFIDVIPVVPPGAVISPTSPGLLAAECGKAPGLPTPNGWMGYPRWTTVLMTPSMCRQYDDAGCSVGLRSRHYPGVDIDVLDRDLSNEIAGIATETFGKGIRRVGRDPKQLLMYATEDAINKQVISFRLDDQDQKIEILGNGQQYVVEGIHPFTQQPYLLERNNFTPADLTPITQDQVRKFLERVVERLDLYGIERGKARAYGAGGRDGSVPSELLITSNFEFLREAVGCLPNSAEVVPDWYEWIKVGAAFHAATQEDHSVGLELWHDFSAKATHKPYDTEMTDKVWRDYKPPYMVGADWLFLQASRFGNFNYAKTIPHLLQAQIESVPNVWHVGSTSWVAEEFMYSTLNKLKVVLEWSTCIIRRTQNWEVDHKNVQTLTAIKKYLKADIFPRLPDIAEDPVATHKSLSDIVHQKRILQSLTEAAFSLVVRANELDRNPDILNTTEGKICLKTGTVIKETANDTTDISLKLAGVVPNFEMPTPAWDKFLDDITGVGHLPDPEMREYLQVYAGYAATGYTNEHIFFLLHGQGGNGKSTFVNTLMSVLGDYAGTVPGDMYCVTRKDMSHYKYMFHGRRLIVSSEFGQRAVWDLGELKRLTGGDTLSARNLYKDPFEFTPTHTVMIASNTKPKIEYIDQAIKRRTRLIPFDFTLAEDRKDQKLDQKLEKEYPGILAWIIRGAMQWHQTGLPKTPLRVLRATDEYFGDNDLIGLWLNECVVCREGENAESGSVFKSWQLFLSRQKEVNTTNTQFIELLKLKGIFKIKIRGKHYYKDIMLKNEEVEDDGKIIPFR